MALDRSSALYHSIPVIATVGVLALVFVLAAVYFGIIYPIRKSMARKRRALAEKADDPTSSDTLEAPRRELHRWVPALPTPSTPGFSSVSFRPNHSNYWPSIRSLSASPSSRATASPSPDNLTGFPATPTAATTLTPPPSAMIGERAVGWSNSQHRGGQDPFADPGPSYVGRAETQGSPRQSPVTVPVPSAYASRHSADSTSTATYSTLPPSYRTHRYTTYGTTPYTQFQNDANPMNLSQATTGEPGQRSRPPRSDRRSGHLKKSMDGGVRIDGGLLDDIPTQGAARPPKYRERRKF